MYHSNAARVALAGSPTAAGAIAPSALQHRAAHTRVADDASRQFRDALVDICLAAPVGVPEPRMRYCDATRAVPRTHPLRAAVLMLLAALDAGKDADLVLEAAEVLPRVVRAYHQARLEAAGRGVLPTAEECFARQQREQAEADVAQAAVVIAAAHGRLTRPVLDRAIKETAEDIAASQVFLERMVHDRSQLVGGAPLADARVT